MIRGEGFVMLHDSQVHGSSMNMRPAWMWKHHLLRGLCNVERGYAMPIGGRNVR